MSQESAQDLLTKENTLEQDININVEYIYIYTQTIILQTVYDAINQKNKSNN